MEVGDLVIELAGLGLDLPDLLQKRGLERFDDILLEALDINLQKIDRGMLGQYLRDNVIGLAARDLSRCAAFVLGANGAIHARTLGAKRDGSVLQAHTDLFKEISSRKRPQVLPQPFNVYRVRFITIDYILDVSGQEKGSRDADIRTEIHENPGAFQRRVFLSAEYDEQCNDILCGESLEFDVGGRRAEPKADRLGGQRILRDVMIEQPKRLFAHDKASQRRGNRCGLEKSSDMLKAELSFHVFGMVFCEGDSPESTNPLSRIP